jgi:hypothetical protein
MPTPPTRLRKAAKAKTAATRYKPANLAARRVVGVGASSAKVKKFADLVPSRGIASSLSSRDLDMARAGKVVE